MEADLFAICDSVHDEESFLEFLRVLMADREREIEIEKKSPSSPYGAGALGWQNWSIEDFLESAIAWAETTSKSTELRANPENPWSRAAQILLAGKIYE